MACLVAFGLVPVGLMRTFHTPYTDVITMIVFSLGPGLTSFSLDHIGGDFVLLVSLSGFHHPSYTLLPRICLSNASAASSMQLMAVKTGRGVSASVLPIAAQALIDSAGLP